MSVTRINELTADQRAQFDAHADRWIEIGLRTGRADRERFDRAARDCYRFAGIDWPGVVVWVPSPLALALAAPAAAVAIESVLRMKTKRETTARAVQEAVDRAVREAVIGAVSGAVDAAVRRAVSGAVNGAVSGAVDGAVRGAVGDVVDGVVHAVQRAILRDWTSYIGGQFWVGGWFWGGAYTSFFRDVCHLELNGDFWDRARAYESTMESACWWWPHRHFVMVCERPTVIHRELTDPSRSRGWGSHRLHCETGPAVVWPDGWGVWAIHGIRLPRQVVEAPQTLTPAQIINEPNAEVRRVMVARFGEARLVRESGALPIHADETGDLYRIDVPGDEPLVIVRVINSTPEPDGSSKSYWIRVPPDMTQARQAIGWTFPITQGGYAPAIET